MTQRRPHALLLAGSTSATLTAAQAVDARAFGLAFGPGLIVVLVLSLLGESVTFFFAHNQLHDDLNTEKICKQPAVSDGCGCH
jgi:hypothetical protein